MMGLVGILLEDVLAGLGIEGRGGLVITGDRPPPTLASRLAVADCATASVAACLVAAADLALARSGRSPDVVLSTDHVAAAVRS
jgi:crotonobetainyl-CoA:carnitine CoA-transferase CaiB-like acyl-CoA transferase